MRIEFTRPGFTLVEIIICIAVIAILATLTVAISSKVTGEAKRTACQSKLGEIGVALEFYLGDNNGRFPDVALAASGVEDDTATLEGALREYLREPEAFHCPADRKVFPRTGSSYFWNSSQSGVRRSRASFLGQEGLGFIPLVADKEAFHGDSEGTNILYADYRTTNEVNFRTASR